VSATTQKATTSPNTATSLPCRGVFVSTALVLLPYFQRIPWSIPRSSPFRTTENTEYTEGLSLRSGVSADIKDGVSSRETSRNELLLDRDGFWKLHRRMGTLALVEADAENSPEE